MNADERRFPDLLTQSVLGAVFEVSNNLGAGFLEKVYERALLHELKLRGIQAVGQVSFPVLYKGQACGEYFADIVVEKTVVIELKCVEHLGKEHMGAMLELPACFGHGGLPADQLSEARGRVEAGRIGSQICFGRRSKPMNADKNSILLGILVSFSARSF